jgi:hypothetical protein
MQRTNRAARLTVCAVLHGCGADSPAGAAPPKVRSWAADNGNGTYSNPLFYDEFSGPDMIRVGPEPVRSEIDW